MSDLFDLHGMTAVVTGARRGIGLAMAKGLAEAGADIIGVSAHADPADEIGTAITGMGRSFESCAVDFADRAAVLDLGAELAKRQPDILINNAGTIERAPAAEYSLESWDRVVDVDLSNQFAFTQLIAAPMLARRRGKVVFTASLLSFQGGINVAAYTAAKSGIAGLTRALGNEWASQGVNVNAIAPGYISTDNTAALRGDPDRSSAILSRIPAGRWGDASDIAGTAVFLCSAASDYISGAVIPVDGGWLAR